MSDISPRLQAEVMLRASDASSLLLLACIAAELRFQLADFFEPSGPICHWKRQPKRNGSGDGLLRFMADLTSAE